jgi:hypothetical protein
VKIYEVITAQNENSLNPLSNSLSVLKRETESLASMLKR